MVTIIRTEFMKLKRYFIVWIGVSLMLQILHRMAQ